jgi:1-acyl-sn-glycerol-3-phosphate acyltransferase
LLLVGNHQLYGFDGPLLLEEMLRERGLLLSALVYPPLLARTSPLAPFPYPLPGTAETFERFGAVPASARNLYRELSQGRSVLLFPGGGREVFKRKGEDYTLFWPDEPDVVRLASRLNATIVPFSGLGGDESFAIAADSDELLRAPIVGDFFRPRVETLPSLVEDDLFLPPFGAVLPTRYYFAFGEPIPTDELAADDAAGIQRVYQQLQRSVLEGIDELRRLRDSDPYADFARRTAFELSNGAQAPPPEVEPSSRSTA